MSGVSGGARAEGTAEVRPGDPVRIAAVASLALIVVYLFLPHDAEPGSLVIRVEAVLYTLPLVFAVVVTAAVARMTRGGERTFWGFLFLVTAFIAVYETPWSLAMWVGRMPPPTDTLASTAMLLVPALLFGGLLLSMDRRSDQLASARLTYVIDGVAVLVVVLVGYHLLFTTPYFVSWGITGFEQQLRASLHATIGIGVLAGIVGHIAGLRVSGWMVWEAYVVAGIALYAFALALTPLYHVGIRVSPHWWTQVHEALLMSGPLLVSIGALARAQAADDQPVFARYLHGMGVGITLSAIKQVVLLGAVVLLMVRAVSIDEPSAERALLMGAAVAVCALLGTRALVGVVDSKSVATRSITDPLSGARVLPFFNERLRVEVEMCTRCGEPLAVLVADLDGFAGHVSGQGSPEPEEVLRTAVGAMVPAVGAADTLARVDGDTFAIMLVGADRDTANDTAAEIRQTVRDAAGLTMCVGIALFPEHGLDPSELRARASRALEWAKAHGPDRAAVYDTATMPSISAIEQPPFLGRTMSPAAIGSLAAAVDARDVNTRHHSRSVADLAVLFATHLCLDADRVRMIEMAALMHDVGKIGMPDRILRKRGPLTAEERATMQEHPVLGQRIVAAAAGNSVAGWVRSHHERWDGTGYPDGLMYDEIPLESRFLALCDAYDAMTSPRSYRPRLSSSAALQEIDLGMGAQFDPVLAEEFIPFICDRVDPSPAVGALKLPRWG